MVSWCDVGSVGVMRGQCVGVVGVSVCSVGGGDQCVLSWCVGVCWCGWGSLCSGDNQSVISWCGQGGVWSVGVMGQLVWWWVIVSTVGEVVGDSVMEGGQLSLIHI